jgi:predicted lactoylglutathione lyase
VSDQEDIAKTKAFVATIGAGCATIQDMEAKKLCLMDNISVLMIMDNKLQVRYKTIQSLITLTMTKQEKTETELREVIKHLEQLDRIMDLKSILLERVEALLDLAKPT